MALWTEPLAIDLTKAARWDAEAFSPFLLSLDSKFEECPVLIQLASVTHPAEIQRVYAADSTDGPLFLLAQNIRPLLPDTSSEFHIQQATADSIPINRLRHGDVLVTRSGANSGMSAVYLGKEGECYASGEGLIVRSLGEIDGAYLCAFFNTTPGQALCRRAIYGSGQPHIGPKYLARARIPRLGSLEEKASSLIYSAYNELKKAESLYPEAQAELLDRIGWQELRKRKVELSYIRTFNSGAARSRTDAEFYEPQYVRLRTRLASRGAEEIGSFCSTVSRGVQPEFVNDGDVLIVDSKAVRPIGIDPSGCSYTSQEFYDQKINKKARVQNRDVLLNSTGRGTLGRATCYQLTEPAICDNHVAILRPDPKVCDPVYLSLFLNSPAGIAQSEQFQAGSSGQLEIYPQHVRQFLVFIPQDSGGKVDIDWQESLADKVDAAIAARSSARSKLKAAVRLVEQGVMQLFGLS